MKMARFSKIFFPLALLIVLTNCEFQTEAPVVEEVRTLNDIDFPADFDFSTKQSVSFKITAATQTEGTLSNVKVAVFGIDNSDQEYMLFTAFTDKEGVINKNYPLPSIIESVILRTTYPGLLHEVEVPVLERSLVVDYSEIQEEENSTAVGLGKGAGISDLHFLSTYNTHGKPFGLVTPQDPIRQEFLNDVNASLPEGLDVNIHHPEYLASGKQINTLLSQSADVWVTYFHEGTDRKNVLGFYHYPVGNPPASLDDIDSLTIIFPNASYPGGGGNLQPGDKMYIGNFPAGTEIGWVLFSNGWEKDVTLGEWQFFSDPSFNPETDPGLRQHNILLYDQARDITVLGFEDENREIGSDDDFNDVLFFITSNPRNAISGENVSTLDYTGADTDGDGAMDHVDSYPTDPELAYDNIYPSQNFFGSLAFEDLWPSKGDYDFNDMVIDYQFKESMNASNQVVKVDVSLVLKAVGASFENGFGFQMETTPDQIGSVTGSLISGSTVQLSNNGTEADQSQAVVVAFDKTSNIIPRPEGGYLNTKLGSPQVAADTLKLSVEFAAPLEQGLIGIPPYNPFIIINQDRAKEVHLPGHAPTSLASNSGLFDTADDNSSVSGYYKTLNYLPWALDIFETLDYPVERATIDSAHNYFVTWAETRGQSYSDWYKDLPGYRRAEKIYNSF